MPVRSVGSDTGAITLSGCYSLDGFPDIPDFKLAGHLSLITSSSFIFYVRRKEQTCLNRLNATGKET